MAITDLAPTIAERRDITPKGEPTWRYRWKCVVCDEHGSAWYAHSTSAITAGKLCHQEPRHGNRLDGTFRRPGRPKPPMA